MTRRPRRRRRRAGALVLVLALALVLVVGVVGVRWALDEASPSRCVFVAAGRTVDLSPEQAGNAATIAGVSVRRGLPPRAATIGIATAIQESKLRNLRYGHADSEGLFQQRPSMGWGTPDQVTDPVYATNAFYDALVKVPDWQDGVITQVAQAVQRSGYPDAYAQHEWEGRVLASTLTGQEGSGTTAGCRLGPARGPGDAAATARRLEEQVGARTRVSGRTLTVRATDREHAWAVAGWALARAEAEELVTIRVDGRVWQRDARRTDLEDDARPVGPTTVVLTLAPSA